MSKLVLPPGVVYDAECRACQRLAAFRDKVKAENPVYFCKPVPPFGDPGAWLVIVGLAPGMHGANATGRPFTGDYAGILLYQTLFDFGWATAPQSRSADDPLRLVGARLTNAVKCLPPENKPMPAESKRCNAYLPNEVRAMPMAGAILALGRNAHDSVLKALDARASAYPFAHGAMHRIEVGEKALMLFDSYHCSRYNTNTGRLTPKMFRDVFESIRSFQAEVVQGRA
jgi:uracil-DNA glycosylase family 4